MYTLSIKTITKLLYEIPFCVNISFMGMKLQNISLVLKVDLWNDFLFM